MSMEDDMSIKERLRSKRVDGSGSKSLLSEKNGGNDKSLDIKRGIDRKRERIENKVIKNMSRFPDYGDHRMYDCFGNEVCELDGFEDKQKFKKNIKDIVNMELSLLEHTYDSPMKLWDVNSVFKKDVDGVTFKSSRPEFSVFSRSVRKAYELAIYLFGCDDDFEDCHFGYMKYKDFVNIDGGD